MGNFPKLPEGTQLPVGSHQVTILKYLSEGGFAHIYKCHIDPPEQDSDIACLKRVIVPDKAGLDTLRKEVEVMKTLARCRNIVKYYDSHAERLADGTYQVLVLMELCPNKSLLDYMNAKIKTKLSEQEILQIILDISIGIYEMHVLKMIHRDIKIENVLIDADNHFKLCDFGSTLGQILPPTNPQEFQMISHDILYQTTPQYRSPEMIDLYRGFPINEKADIWAFGCFLYKLCFYTTPFEANGDIAILHASFQFPSKPKYSGDLLNLIIIMLQENPNFRPNIVQVILLISKMMSIEFKDLGIKDIYKLGSYNFNALHAYQQQKQQQQHQQQQQHHQHQQQQLLAQANSASVSRSASSLNVQASQFQPLVQQPGGEANHLKVPKQPLSSYATGKSSKSRDDSVRSSLDGDNYGLGLDDAEERYPSLENLSIDPVQKAPNLPVAQQLTAIAPVPVTTQQAFSLQPPPVLSKSELQKLSPDQQQAYNYQHQVYQYEVSKFQYQQQQYQRQYQEQYQYQQQQQQVQQQLYQQSQVPLVPSKNQELQPLRSQSKSRKSSEPSDLDKKEAWEKQSNTSNIHEDTEKLVSDIFGTGEGLSRAHTRQSSKSERSQNLSKSREDLSRYKSREDEFLSPPSISANTVENDNDVEFDSHSLLDEKDLIEFETQFPETLNENNITTETPKVDKEVVPAPVEILRQKAQEISRPVEAPVSKVESLESTSVPNGSNKNPFPVEKESIPLEKYSSISSEKLSTSAAEKKNANPWGEYRKAQPQDAASPVSNSVPVSVAPSMSIKNPPINSQVIPDESLNNKIPAAVSATLAPGSLPVHVPVPVPMSHFSYPTQSQMKPEKKDELKQFQLPSQINLIDLEVGLESSSAASTPALKPKSIYLVDQQEDSLLDLNIEEEKINKPIDQRKKRISSGVNIPSTINFQEEVIDWASDDENPENSSKMNRLSIRNSLKTSKPKRVERRSGEFKRSESDSSNNLNSIKNNNINNNNSTTTTTTNNNHHNHNNSNNNNSNNTNNNTNSNNNNININNNKKTKDGDEIGQSNGSSSQLGSTSKKRLSIFHSNS